jgi:hypothetical protein
LSVAITSRQVNHILDADVRDLGPDRKLSNRLLIE